MALTVSAHTRARPQDFASRMYKVLQGEMGLKGSLEAEEEAEGNDKEGGDKGSSGGGDGKGGEEEEDEEEAADDGDMPKAEL